MSERYDGQTYYEILEVKTNAAPAEIYAAYQKARSTYSPSSPALYSMFTPEEAQALMALIEEAYQTLSHQARRQEYDNKLGIMPTPAKSATHSETTERSSGPEAWVGTVKVTEKSQAPIPKGCARTKFSVYKMNPEMEQEIANMTECDGQLLQKIRTYKGVSLDQVSEEIRVTKSTLVSLESDDLASLPAAVFTRGFVLQYARVLGLDERKTAEAYMTYFKANKV